MTDASHPEASRSLDDGQKLVSLNQRDIKEAARLLTLIAGANPAGRQAATADNPLHAWAALLIRMRRRRLGYFGIQMFGEPAWDMLLTLYVEESGERFSQRRLAELSGASRSTAMRWIEHLEQRELVQIDDHPTDKKRNFVSLSEKGRKLLELFLSETMP